MSRVLRQAAVVPYRIRRRRIEVALVTSSRGDGWILPKGSVDDGERLRATALREAEEEAGLLGVLAPKALGRYRRTNGNGSCLIHVFLMEVTEVLARWPEEGLRRRRWMRLPAAEASLRQEQRRFIRAVEQAVGYDGRA